MYTEIGTDQLLVQQQQQQQQQQHDMQHKL